MGSVPEIIEELYMISKMIDSLPESIEEGDTINIEFNKLIERRNNLIKELYNLMGFHS